MEMWFSDEHTDHARLSLRVERQLFSAESEYQRIDVLESTEFGKVLVVDGDLMLTEKDEFIYHEMITHVPMAVHPDVKRVLVIGGGDGGVVRELIKYETLETIDVVEIDPLLVEVCRKYLPEIACSLTDPRVEIYHEDGLRFIRSKTDEYDLIIIDSPNPFGTGEGLFTKEFYGNCYRALKEDGIMVYQHGSPFYDEDEESCRVMHRKASHSFPVSRVYQAHIPTYAAGYWLFGFASKKYHPLDDLDAEKWQALNLKTNYYTTRLHKGAFYLPAFLERLLEEVE